ncbi:MULTISPECIES: hypothetical protein [unclassified Leifsonia]|uniref:hypothetical protein n=1 Tax=unclassified Leifsonia TaxID=2663824 RepID=UPI0008A806C2|nr:MULTISPECIES: hypothetical protein [unclassified Leifsonia]SEH83948.1 hypothetical protein SAMN04515694_10529 [Leifsonia sp. CL154]SFL46553.1 hypothetical protein SAMN04515692_10528 [Leifsonia sp. CL147]
MLTVEQRHALIVCFEAARRAAKTFEQTHARSARGVPVGIDTVLSVHIEDEAAQRDFYELLNSVTDWGMHPAVREVTS